MKEKSFFAVVGSIFWTFIFLSGLGIVFLFLFGYRYDFSSGRVVETGVIFASSSPSAPVLINDALRFDNPLIEYGVPFGMLDLCFEKGGFTPYCRRLDFQPPYVEKLEGVFLWPQDFNEGYVQWGAYDQVYWDEKDRGFFFFDKDVKQVSGVNFSQRENVLREIQDDVLVLSWEDRREEFLFEQGFLQSVSEEFLNVDLNMREETRDFVHRVNQIYIYDTARGVYRELLYVFDDPIVHFEPIYEKELLFVQTATQIFLARFTGDEVRRIADYDPLFPVMYSSARFEMFWVQDGMIQSFGL